MRGTLIVVTGTGTDVGKTHVARALLQRASKDREVCGFKPIESGVEGTEGADGRLLAMFHVKHPASPYLFRRAVSPHLAARDEGIAIAIGPILDAVATLQTSVPNVVIELAGGLFSPLGPGLLNVDLAVALSPTSLLLVAADRLGVLHDAAAVTRAMGDRLAARVGIVLNAPLYPDASSGTNGSELPLVTRTPVVATIPRADADTLSRHPEIEKLFRWAFPPT